MRSRKLESFKSLGRSRGTGRGVVVAGCGCGPQAGHFRAQRGLGDVGWWLLGVVEAPRGNAANLTSMCRAKIVTTSKKRWPLLAFLPRLLWSCRDIGFSAA